MNIAVLGAGFTGLTAALRLLQQGHQVTLFEKEKAVGGLAGGFKQKGWDWTLEKSYHHFFTNDFSALNLAKELNHPVIIKRPLTKVLVNNEILPLDSPMALLKFPYLGLLDRVRVGTVLFYLKLITHKQTKGKKAMTWLKTYMGQKAWDIIWDPLFTGKFGDFKNEIALSWFWARIKKRTPSLAYPEGGFQAFAEKLADKVKELGGEIYLEHEIKACHPTSTFINLMPTLAGCNRNFDKVIITLPTPIFTKITPQLPPAYVKRINSIPHLYALNLILILKEPFMDNTYWLNITQKEFPFLVLAEHTNFMDKKNYGNQHILYIGNYLPENHPYLKISVSQLLKIYDPYLKKINPDYQQSVVDHQLFSSPFAQPIVTTDYPILIPTMETPIKNIYLANLDMVYPWDRGTNYAIEMGEKVAGLIDENN